MSTNPTPDDHDNSKAPTDEPEVTESLPEPDTTDVNNDNDSVFATPAVVDEEVLQTAEIVEEVQAPIAKEAEAPIAEEAAPAEKSPSPPQEPAKKKLCGVCNEKEFRYKCTRCMLPFCSMACSTIHKATHPAEEPKPATELKAHPTLPAKPIVARPGTIAGAEKAATAAANSKGPFAALDDSKELQQLFKKYPRLPMLLDRINKVTLPPVNGFQPAQNGGRGKEQQQWNSDRGLQKGVRSLNELRNTNSKDGRAIREFSKLVLRLLSPEEGLTAREVVEQELAEENQKVIEQLLNGER
ncbi:hypothetical protein VTL71DRAFT_10698 [Oculimacula yallundae]|uniref:HIT-type domain-containing protein n=1 Tax=Oculimacula yallundae TaxID=86028 RepID=A0ABR4CTS2_9HELO